jgi:hypothetical protein
VGAQGRMSPSVSRLIAAMRLRIACVSNRPAPSPLCHPRVRPERCRDGLEPLDITLERTHVRRTRRHR